MFSRLTFSRTIDLVFLSALLSAAIAFFSSGIPRAIFGSYLVIFPVGFFFIASVFEENKHLSPIERLALGLASSLALIPVAVLALFFSAGVPIDFHSNLLVVLALSAIFYIAFKLRTALGK